MIKLGTYCHYKGGEYVVIAIGKNEETMEDVIVYKALYGSGSVWVRTLKVFEENVKKDGVLVPRFKFLK